MRVLFPALTTALLIAGPALAGDDGLTGHWKFHIYQGGQQITFWLLHLESKDGMLSASVDSLRGGPKAKVEEIKLVGDLFTMKFNATFISRGKPAVIAFDYEGKLPKPGARKIYGSMKEEDGSALPSVLEATSAKNTFELDREVLVKTPMDPKALVAIVDVIEQAKANNIATKDLGDWIDASLKTAELYGPRMQLKQQVRLLDAMQAEQTYASLAADLARKVLKQIDTKAPADTQSQLMTMIANIFHASGASEEARGVETLVDKLEGPAYSDYSKTALNYKLEKYAGRKAKSERAVLVELFTGAQCPPCVAADMAFDGVEKTYGPGEAVLLQYHMHIPRPDPMSNNDSEERFDYYAEAYSKQIGGTPAVLFNGKPEAQGGGSRADAGDKYLEYVGVLNRLLEVPTTVKLSASALRKGNKVAILANVNGLEKPGDKMRLRLVLVEDWVRYRGGNGLQYHHRVVRALPAGVKGVALKEKDVEHKASIDLVELRKNLNKYLDDQYPEGPRPMRMRHLSVVALVQNDETTEVLQAINVPLREE